MTGNRYTAIIAEDEVLLLESLVEKVESLQIGVEVIATANNGRRAMEEIAKAPPDLLITDIRMPLMDGLQLVEWLGREYVEVRKIIVSGYSEFDYARRAIRHGVQDYLLKPVSAADLRGALLSAILSIRQRGEERGQAVDTPAGNLSQEQVVQFLYEHIRANYAQEMNFGAIIGDFHYSPYYINRLFVRQYHESPSKYQVRLRMNVAKKLLIGDSALSVRQVAEQVGYQDQSYFSRIFKKHTGVSPLDYRR